MLSFSTSQEKKDTAYLEIYYIGIMFTQDQREAFFFFFSLILSSLNCL